MHTPDPPTTHHLSNPHPSWTPRGAHVMCKTPRGGHRDSGELQATCSCARPCCCPGQACCYSIAGRGERDPQTLLLSPLLSLGVSSELEVIGEHPQLCLELSEEYFFAQEGMDVALGGLGGHPPLQAGPYPCCRLQEGKVDHGLGVQGKGSPSVSPPGFSF